MRLLWLSLAILVLGSAPATAQNSHGYLFAAPGGVSVAGRTDSTLQFGGGGELLLARGFGLGGEIGALSPSGNLGGTVGLLSGNAYYHFGSKRRIDPYITGGYSLFFRGNTANSGNFGAGVNLWLWKSLGLKVEFRDHVASPGGVTAHWWGVRFGLNF
jgi:hypothetical protein